MLIRYVLPANDPLDSIISINADLCYKAFSIWKDIRKIK